jgi:hypothetical protein
MGWISWLSSCIQKIDWKHLSFCCISETWHVELVFQVFVSLSRAVVEFSLQSHYVGFPVADVLI